MITAKDLTPAAPLTRITIPGVTDGPGTEIGRAILGEAAAHRAHLRREQKGLARAMVALGKPIFRGVPKKAPKPGANARYAARMQARTGTVRPKTDDVFARLLIKQARMTRARNGWAA